MLVCVAYKFRRLSVQSMLHLHWTHVLVPVGLYEETNSGDREDGWIRNSGGARGGDVEASVTLVVTCRSARLLSLSARF